MDSQEIVIEAWLNQLKIKQAPTKRAPNLRYDGMTLLSYKTFPLAKIINDKDIGVLVNLNAMRSDVQIPATMRQIGLMKGIVNLKLGELYKGQPKMVVVPTFDNHQLNITSLCNIITVTVHQLHSYIHRGKISKYWDETSQRVENVKKHLAFYNFYKKMFGISHDLPAEPVNQIVTMKMEGKLNEHFDL